MSAWQDVVTAALIGTERAVVPQIEIAGLAAAGNGSGDPAAALLDRAALLTAARRAGLRPSPAEPPPAAGPDPRPVVSPAAGRRLARLLAGEHADLLPEWLAAARGLRPPPQLLPPLLDRAGHLPAGPGSSRLLHLVAEAGGARACWLAGLNPEWKFLLAGTGTEADAWRLGTSGQRRGYLAALRGRDPGAARDLVADSWEAAGAGERAMFVSVLADALEPADEALLETALDDAAEEVRRGAAHLLARLPSAALGRRMAERAVHCLRLEHTVRGPRLVVIPPAGTDAEMRRDGITPGPAAGRSRPADRSRLMLELLARTPLRTWTDRFGQPAARIAAVPAGDWAPVLLLGWSRAAIAQDDRQWMTALVVRALTCRPPGTPAETGAVRQLARHADPRLGAPGALPAPDPEAPPVTREATRVLRFRYEMLKELDDDDGNR